MAHHAVFEAWRRSTLFSSARQGLDARRRQPRCCAKRWAAPAHLYCTGPGGGAAAAHAPAEAPSLWDSEFSSSSADDEGEEEQDEVEDAAGSSSGGSETERLEPVCCGTVGSEQITEAAHPPSAADDAK